MRPQTIKRVTTLLKRIYPLKVSLSWIIGYSTSPYISSYLLMKNLRTPNSYLNPVILDSQFPRYID